MRRFALALVLGIVASASPLHALEDLDAIQKRGTLRVLIVLPPSDQPQFWSDAPGTPPGFEREMVDAFAAMRKLAVEVVPVKEWPDIGPALVDGKGDVIVGRFTETASRAERIRSVSTARLDPSGMAVSTSELCVPPRGRPCEASSIRAR